MVKAAMGAEAARKEAARLLDAERVLEAEAKVSLFRSLFKRGGRSGDGGGGDDGESERWATENAMRG